MKVVCGAAGIKVTVPVAEKSDGDFGFMESDVSSEKPQAVLVRQVADGMREAKEAGKKVLWVGGPGVVHTGAAPAMVALVEAGYVDVLFAGNALATHDIESALYGTSLGIDLAQGQGVEHGHEHHIRAINTIRKAGSIGAAVEQGVLTSGIMHALVTHDKEFVLVGSVRDDGPLPDVYTDVIDGQRAMRAKLADVGLLPDGGDDAALGGDREHPAGLGAARLRRHQPGHRHQAGRPRVLAGPRHRHRRRALPRATRDGALPHLPTRLIRPAVRARSATPTTPASGPSSAPTSSGRSRNPAPTRLSAMRPARARAAAHRRRRPRRRSTMSCGSKAATRLAAPTPSQCATWSYAEVATRSPS